MPSGDEPEATRLHLGGLGVLLVEADPMEAEIARQVLAGLGMRRMAHCTDAAEAAWHLRGTLPDLLVAGAALPAAGGPDQYDLIRQLRRTGAAAAQLPVILLAGHTSRANVLRARDCGASIVMAKPVVPDVLFDRLAWLATDTRPFVLAESYAGPDRRRRPLGPPAGIAGRRRDDAAPDVWRREGDPTGHAPLPAHTMRWAGLVSRPGGVCAAEASAAAERSLVQMRGGALERIGATLRHMQTLAGPGLATHWAELYRLANTLVGTAGAFGLGSLAAVALRLCAMIDRAPPAPQGLTAARLHVDSLRLVHAGGLDDAQARAI